MYTDFSHLTKNETERRYPLPAYARAEAEYGSGAHTRVLPVGLGVPYCGTVLCGFLTVETTDIPVYITRSADDMIHVSYVSDTEVEVYDDGGRLVIEQVPSFVITLYTAEQFSYRIEIQLPDKPFESLNLYSASTDLHCCAVSGYMVNIRCKSGSAEIEQLSCTGTLDIECDSGRIDMYIDEFSGGKLVNSSGSIDIDFAEDADTVISPGTRCYINGLAAMSDGRAAESDDLGITSPSGRVRINTKVKR